MKDHVVFNEDLSLDGELIFAKGVNYSILSESKDNIYVSYKGSDIQCSEFNKSLEGLLFEYK